MTAIQKLGTIAAKEKMRPLDLCKYKILPAANDPTTKLSSLLSEFDGYERILIVENNKSFRLLIYRSMIEKYLSKFALSPTPLPNGKAAADLTLKDLLDSDPSFLQLFTKVVDFVGETATLATAKGKMDAIEHCNDVFVTKTGQRIEPIMGWITDNTVAENSRV